MHSIELSQIYLAKVDARNRYLLLHAEGSLAVAYISLCSQNAFEYFQLVSSPDKNGLYAELMLGLHLSPITSVVLRILLLTVSAYQCQCNGLFLFHPADPRGVA